MWALFDAAPGRAPAVPGRRSAALSGCRHGPQNHGLDLCRVGDLVAAAGPGHLVHLLAVGLGADREGEERYRALRVGEPLELRDQRRETERSSWFEPSEDHDGVELPLHIGRLCLLRPARPTKRRCR
jgi:hypothetical protein